METLIQRSAVAPLSAHNRQTLDDPSQPRSRDGRGAVREGDAFLSAIGSGCPVLRPHHPRDGARMPSARRRQSVMGIGGVALIDRALSSSDFPLMLADTMGRTLRASYDQATSAIKRLGRETTANDFRTKHRLMLDSGGLTLENVTELGEFRYGGMTEGEETYALTVMARSSASAARR